MGAEWFHNGEWQYKDFGRWKWEHPLHPSRRRRWASSYNVGEVAPGEHLGIAWCTGDGWWWFVSGSPTEYRPIMREGHWGQLKARKAESKQAAQEAIRAYLRYREKGPAAVERHLEAVRKLCERETPLAQALLARLEDDTDGR
jgi:hypothetical protein